MCDFSLQAVKSRPAKVADKLTTKNFGYGTTGFADAADTSGAVCVLPGTEIAFDQPLKVANTGFFGSTKVVNGAHATAIFRQINKDKPNAHHDALELPDGQIVMLTSLPEGQGATVLQLPAAPKTEAEAQDQKRVEFIG